MGLAKDLFKFFFTFLLCISLFIVLLYIVVALVKLFVFHSCTIDVFLRYVRIKKFIIIIIFNGRRGRAPNINKNRTFYSKNVGILAEVFMWMFFFIYKFKRGWCKAPSHSLDMCLLFNSILVVLTYLFFYQVVKLYHVIVLASSDIIM